MKTHAFYSLFFLFVLMIVNSLQDVQANDSHSKVKRNPATIVVPQCFSSLDKFLMPIQQNIESIFSKLSSSTPLSETQKRFMKKHVNYYKRKHPGVVDTQGAEYFEKILKIIDGKIAPSTKELHEISQMVGVAIDSKVRPFLDESPLLEALLLTHAQNNFISSQRLKSDYEVKSVEDIMRLLIYNSQIILPSNRMLFVEDIIARNKISFNVDTDGIDLHTSSQFNFHHIKSQAMKAKNQGQSLPPALFDHHGRVVLVDELVESFFAHGEFDRLQPSQYGVVFETVDSSTYFALDLKKRAQKSWQDDPYGELPGRYWDFIGNIYKSRLGNILDDASIEKMKKASREFEDRTVLILKTNNPPLSGDIDEVKIKGGVAVVYSSNQKELLPIEASTGIKISREGLGGGKVVEIGRYTMDRDVGIADSQTVLNYLAGILYSDRSVKKVVIYVPKAQAKLYRRLFPDLKEIHHFKDDLSAMEISSEDLLKSFLVKRYNQKNGVQIKI